MHLKKSQVSIISTSLEKTKTNKKHLRALSWSEAQPTRGQNENRNHAKSKVYNGIPRESYSLAFPFMFNCINIHEGKIYFFIALEGLNRGQDKSNLKQSINVVQYMGKTNININNIFRDKLKSRVRLTPTVHTPIGSCRNAVHLHKAELS